MEKINEHFRSRTTKAQKRKNEVYSIFPMCRFGCLKIRVLEIKSIAMRMREEGSKDTEPSQKQLEFAQFLCDKKGLKIQNEVLGISKALRMVKQE